MRHARRPNPRHMHTHVRTRCMRTQRQTRTETHAPNTPAQRRLETSPATARDAPPPHSPSHTRTYAHTRGGEEELAVQAAVLLRVLHTDGLEALADRRRGFIRGQDALARGRDRVLCQQRRKIVRGRGAAGGRGQGGGRTHRNDQRETQATSMEGRGEARAAPCGRAVPQSSKIRCGTRGEAGEEEAGVPRWQSARQRRV